MNQKAKQGDIVAVHYTGKLDNGSIFDSSKGKSPLQFTVGSGELIAGFDEAVLGMSKGEKKEIKILAENAYGPYRPELVSVIKLTQLPPHIQPQVGLELQLTSEEFSPIIATITEMTDEELTLDANHPLAGLDLIFEIEVVDVNAQKG